MESKILVTIPHSGEKVPTELTPWLANLSEDILMCDVDRYVDRLYEPALKALALPHIKTEWHRYAGDLNRLDTDVDQDSVEGSKNAPGKFSRGFHWVKTTTEIQLMKSPMAPAVHDSLVELIYHPFHQAVQKAHHDIHKRFGEVYHLDLHSMPHQGTSQHRDPGEARADVVISDQMGKSCSSEFRDLVAAAYFQAGFKIKYNWPYFGGRITEHYGHPKKNIHVIQVEMNRSLYMDESTKQIRPVEFEKIQGQLKSALDYLVRRG